MATARYSHIISDKFDIYMEFTLVGIMRRNITDLQFSLALPFGFKNL